MLFISVMQNYIFRIKSQCHIQIIQKSFESDDFLLKKHLFFNYYQCWKQLSLNIMFYLMYTELKSFFVSVKLYNILIGFGL